MSPRIHAAALAMAVLAAGADARAQALDPNRIGQAQQAARSVPELRQEAGRASREGDHPVFRDAMAELHRQRPFNSDYMYQLALAHAQLDQKQAAFDIMLKMQRQGLSYDFDQSDASTSLRNTQLYGYLNDLMKMAGRPLGESTAIATLPADFVRPEAIDWDEGRQAFLVGNVRDGAIVGLSRDGTRKELLRADAANGMWGVYDLLVDRERNRLWVASASNRQFGQFDPVDTGRSALFEFDLDSLELLGRHPVPVDGLPHNLRNLALAPNGDIYAVDGLYPILYRKLAGESRLQPVMALKELVALRGMDFSPDGKLLYLADHELGVVVVDVASGRGAPLLIPDTLNLGGIEGLVAWRDRLVVIQNGIRPQRIMSLQLDPTGGRVVNMSPLAVSLEFMDFPNYGTVVGGDLVYFANSHWSQRDEELKPVTVASVSIANAPEIVPPDFEKFMSDYQSAKQRGKVGKGDPERIRKVLDEPPPEEEEPERE